MKNLTNKFEEIFTEVMNKLNIEAWYELFDSDNFAEVKHQIALQLGSSVLHSIEYQNWYNEMCEEL